MTPGAVGAVVASIALPIVFAMLRRWFPVPPTTLAARPLDELRKEYGKWSALEVLLLFVIAPPASFLWWKLFVSLASGIGFSQDGVAFSLRPTHLAWSIPAGFLGILTSAPIIEMTLRQRRHI